MRENIVKVKLAKKIGFCFGVKRAVDMAEAALKNKGPIYSLGSIIHNQQVVEDLSKKGLKVVKDVKKIKRGVVVISSHGISPVVAKSISKRGIKLIDTTCPFVLNAQRIAKSLSEASYNVIIVGDASHPEIKALVDFVSTNVFVVKGESEANALDIDASEKFIILAQTTQSTDNFLDVVRAISEKRPKELRIFNTICRDAEERQEAARLLAGSVDAMFVVGGKSSANTKRLFEVCKKVLNNSHLVETEKDLRKRWLDRARSVGVTSGASTPDWIVKKVVNKIQAKDAQKTRSKRRMTV